MRRFLALAVWLIALVAVGAFVGPHWLLPPAISAHSRMIDSQLKLTLIVVGVGFLLAHAALGLAIWRGKRAGASSGNSRTEIFLTSIVALIFIALAATGQRVWSQLKLNQVPPEAIHVEVTGQQFAWNFRYPGADGRFGQTDPGLYNDADTSIGARPGPLGIDPRDPSGQDDVVSGLMVIPVNRPIALMLRAKDVTHNFYVPALRLKHDAVPGMKIKIHFTAIKEGRYEIACAELCGQLHHQMRAYLEVKSQSEYEQWLGERLRNKRK